MTVRLSPDSVTKKGEKIGDKFPRGMAITPPAVSFGRHALERHSGAL